MKFLNIIFFSFVIYYFHLDYMHWLYIIIVSYSCLIAPKLIVYLKLIFAKLKVITYSTKFIIIIIKYFSFNYYCYY